MLNFLDLLIIVFMVLAAVSLLALCLMFLVRNPRIKKVCFYIVSVLGIYTGYIGVRIGKSLFPVQTVVGVIVAAVSIAAIVLAATAKDNQKKFKIAQFVATGAWMVVFTTSYTFFGSFTRLQTDRLSEDETPSPFGVAWVSLVFNPLRRAHDCRSFEYDKILLE